MKTIKQLIPLLFIFVLVQCRTTRPLSRTDQARASITRQGWFNCFEKGLAVNGVPVWCEASAVLYDGKNVLFANDKDMPGAQTSVFYWAFRDGFPDTASPATYLSNPVLKYAKKFEDFASTPDGKLVFLSTGFDRTKPGTREWDGYNTILYWQPGDENNPTVLTENNADSSSTFLREKFSKALTSPQFPQGMPYFKIEGLAATNDKLYFGIREEGKKFDDFKYTIKILTVGFQYNNNKVELEDDFKMIADINMNNTPPFFKQPMGISSIEYDHFNKRFLLLTSFENGEKTGGYLWTATQDELENNKINLVRNGSGNPIGFTNKSEDLTIISRNKILVIHDDDRNQPILNGQVRQPNQAAFSVVEFK